MEEKCVFNSKLPLLFVNFVLAKICFLSYVADFTKTRELQSLKLIATFVENDHNNKIKVVVILLTP